MNNIPETLAKLAVPIDSIKPYPHNPRNGDTDLIADSLTFHGQYRPIVVNKRTSEILAGNHTYAAALSLGWTKIAVTFVDVDEDTAARIVLMDNRANDVARYDAGQLTELLESLDGLDGTGFDADALAKLISEADKPLEFTDAPVDDLPNSFGVVVECDNENQQRTLLEKLTTEGYRVRALMYQ